MEGLKGLCFNIYIKGDDEPFAKKFMVKGKLENLCNTKASCRLSLHQQFDPNYVPMLYIHFATVPHSHVLLMMLSMKQIYWIFFHYFLVVQVAIPNRVVKLFIVIDMDETYQTWMKRHIFITECINSSIVE